MKAIIMMNRRVFRRAAPGIGAIALAGFVSGSAGLAQLDFGATSVPEPPTVLQALAERRAAVDPAADSADDARGGTAVPATAAEGDGGAASPLAAAQARDVAAPPAATAPGGARPAKRPAADRAPAAAAPAASDPAAEGPRPVPRQVGVGMRVWAYGPADKARLRGLIAEASALVEAPPGALEGASDLACLAVSIYHEARNQPRLGQRAVASVILRRAELPRWGETVCAVVQPVQFSYLTADRRFPPIAERAAWREALTVAIAALMEGPATTVAEADHYHATYVRPGWRTRMRRVAQIGAHVFYSDPRSRVAQEAAEAAPLRAAAVAARPSGG
jgi:spore germination cell wall hydrolase CwlJ-like protein